MKREREISLLNVAFCLMVIFIHVTSSPISELLKDSWQFKIVFVPWRLSAFVVQGFIFLSGLKLFLNYNEKIDYKKYYISRFTKIIIPYIISVGIFYVYFKTHGYFGFNLKDFLGYCVKGDLVSHFYFVIVIIQFYFLLPVWRKIVSHSNVVLTLIISLMIMLILGQNLPELIAIFKPNYYFKYNDRVFTTYLFYWIAGCFVGKNYDYFKNILKDKRKNIFILFVIISSINAVLSYLNVAEKIKIIFLENIHILYSILAILFVYSISLLIIEKNPKKNRFINVIDRNSYDIYLIHPLVIFIINDWMYKYSVNSICKSYLIRIFITYTVSILLCISYNCFKKQILILLKKEAVSKKI